MLFDIFISRPPVFARDCVQCFTRAVLAWPAGHSLQSSSQQELPSNLGVVGGNGEKAPQNGTCHSCGVKSQSKCDSDIFFRPLGVDDERSTYVGPPRSTLTGSKWTARNLLQEVCRCHTKSSSKAADGGGGGDPDAGKSSGSDYIEDVD
eukprot:1184095-Prorocentrum_minimum.AAC.1